MSWLSRLFARLLPAPPSIEPGEDVLFVDVRTAPEFAAGHAKGAVHIPLGQVADRSAELQPHADRRLLVYCLSGHRAARAVRALKASGLPHVENAGGIDGLRRAGIEIERGR